MSKLSELAHWLWMEIQLAAPPFVQRGAMPFLHRAKEIARLLARPYMPLYELRGHNQAGPLTVTYGGLGYAKPLLKSLLFLEEPAETELGRVLLWRPGELHLPGTCEASPWDSDLTIIEASRHLNRKLPSQGAITLPFRLQFVLDLQGEWEQVEGRFHRSMRRHIRKAKRYAGHEYVISHRAQDLAMFYHTMYLPTMQNRHGELADILPEREAYQLLRHGWLFLVQRDAAYVCGSLGRVREGIVEFKEMGVLNGDLALMREDVVDAMNYLRIRWAHQEGYKSLSFGECWPYLSGIFSSKRKWGAAVSIPPHEHKQIWIRIQRATPAVSHFFQDNPCVIVNGKGELHALIVTDDPEGVTPETGATWHKLYATPGLRGLLIYPVTDLLGKLKINSIPT